MNDRMRYAGMGSPPCACGCGQMVPPGARYASASHRARAYDQRNPRVNKAPPEVLEQSLREALAASEEGFARQREDKARRPRKPRVHIDVLAEDAELLDRLAGRAEMTRTGYVRALLRAASENLIDCPVCLNERVVPIDKITAGDQSETIYGDCPHCTVEPLP